MMFKDQLLNASEFVGSHPRGYKRNAIGASTAAAWLALAFLIIFF